MRTDTKTHPLASIFPLLEKYAVPCSVEEFHQAVNVTFHKRESAVYNQIHHAMWESIPEQFTLLIEDYFSKYPQPGSSLRMLDIGCGTGLASNSVLATRLGAYVEHVDLLDLSEEMLAKARAKSAAWNIPVETIHGTIDQLPADRSYDVIVICSVLHHIPDLAAFLASVRRIQKPGGIVLHLQDPNGDYLKDAQLRERKQSYSASREPRIPEWLRRLSPARVVGRIVRELRGTQGTDYLSLTNQDLLAAGIISRPMSPHDIWAVTDIHDDLETGVSIRELARYLPEYELVSRRSYGFFGVLAAELNGTLREQERAAIAGRLQNGQYAGALWRLR
jgi:2-polyprenyl-3-methyl-5-hydroxy-6-metoxy-1,4-benzoquinol methylase